MLCAPNPQESEAMDHVAGFTVAHDVSARDWQLKKNGGQWLLGKTFDTFCPLGPALVTKDTLSSKLMSPLRLLAHYTRHVLASWGDTALRVFRLSDPR